MVEDYATWAAARRWRTTLGGDTKVDGDVVVDNLTGTTPGNDEAPARTFTALRKEVCASRHVPQNGWKGGVVGLEASGRDVGFKHTQG